METERVALLQARKSQAEQEQESQLVSTATT